MYTNENRRRFDRSDLRYPNELTANERPFCCDIVSAGQVLWVEARRGDAQRS